MIRIDFSVYLEVTDPALLKHIEKYFMTQGGRIKKVFPEARIHYSRSEVIS